MKRARERSAQEGSEDGVLNALAAYGERFMSMFDDYDKQAPKRAKQPAATDSQLAAADADSGVASSSDEEDDHSQAGGTDAEDNQGSIPMSQQPAPTVSTANSKLQEFLSGRKGNRRSKTAVAVPSKEQLAAQARQREQQRLLERKLKKQFMSSKVDKIFNGVDVQQLAAVAAGADEASAQELTAEEFAAMKRDVEQLGASALDKRSAKAYKAAMLAKLGASADKRPRIPAKMGLGMAKKAKQREALALQEAIAAGMVKAKGRGKKQRALKAKQRDKGLMEAGPGFKNGVLRLPKSAL